MAGEPETKGHIIDYRNLPADFPTHMHPAEFWETLGRTVATFGFLEEALGKAIFSFRGTRRIPEDQVDAEYEKWGKTLEKALTDALGGLVDSYGKAVRDNKDAKFPNLEDLLTKLRKASAIRNLLCHGSWNSKPDDQGQSFPMYFNRKLESYDAPIDIAYLHQLQAHVVELACAVINSVTLMGWQFPGSSGPGIPVYRRSEAA
jgi:hypothetical protein